MKEKIYLDERTKKMLEFVSPNKKEKILIIGTGVFPKIEYFLYKKYGCQNIISGDIESENILNGSKILPSLKFVYLNAQKKFLFKDKTFDKIIMTEVLEHLKEEDFVLREIHRTLKNKGYLIISVPKFRWYKIFSPITLFQHLREYNEYKIKEVLKKNKFKIDRLFVGGNIFELFNLWIHLIKKHIFKKLEINSNFQKSIDKSYMINQTNFGSDILIRAIKLI